MNDFGLKLEVYHQHPKSSFVQKGVMWCVECRANAAWCKIHNNGKYDAIMDIIYVKGHQVYLDSRKTEEYDYWGFCSVECCLKFVNKYASEIVMELANSYEGP